MSRGRPKKPEAQKQIEGTYRKCRDNGAEAALTIPLSSVDMPISITVPKAIAAWGVIVPALVNTSRVSAEDLPTLELMILALQDIYTIDDMKNRILGKKKRGKNDLSDIAKLIRLLSTRQKDFFVFASRFGITPSERGRLVVGVGNALKSKSIIDGMISDGS